LRIDTKVNNYQGSGVYGPKARDIESSANLILANGRSGSFDDRYDICSPTDHFFKDSKEK
jgi:hypothetical protein